MKKIKCHICKAKNNEMICKRCGVNLSDAMIEQLMLLSGGYIYYNDNKKYVDKFSSCRFSFTNKRSENQAIGLFIDLVNTVIKIPCISINLDDIEWVRRYDTRHLIKTNIDTYQIWSHKDKQIDELFAPYKNQREDKNSFFGAFEEERF